MAAEDIVVEDGRCLYRPLLASAGDTLTCPKGHPVADIVQDLRVGTVPMPDMFSNWRGRPGWTPRVGDVAAGIEPDPFPLCLICGGDPWVGPQGDLRPWTQHGYRCLPGDPDEPYIDLDGGEAQNKEEPAP